MPDLLGVEPGDAVDSVAHVVQVALTPVFLLSGIGTLLNVFNTRLSRVSDHREHATEMLRDEDGTLDHGLLRAHLRRLRQRTLVLDASIAFGAIGGASTLWRCICLVSGGSLRNAAIAAWLV